MPTLKTLRSNFSTQIILKSTTPFKLQAGFPTKFQTNQFTTSIRMKEDSKPTRKSIPIYTRTGDKGTSSLFTGERRSKSDIVFDCLGTVDELSSNIGLAREFILEVEEKESLSDLISQLEKIQCCLQDVGSNVATPYSSDTKYERKVNLTRFDTEGELVLELESQIDKFDEILPPLRNFILPSGGKPAASLHVCRAVCRRAERLVSQLVKDGSVDEGVGKYLNRLSDFLFAGARYVSFSMKKEEVIYRNPLRKK